MASQGLLDLPVNEPQRQMGKLMLIFLGTQCERALSNETEPGRGLGLLELLDGPDKRDKHPWFLAPSTLCPALNVAVMLGIRQPSCDHEGKSEPIIWHAGLMFLKNQIDANSSRDPDILLSKQNKALSQVGSVTRVLCSLQWKPF